MRDKLPVGYLDTSALLAFVSENKQKIRFSKIASDVISSQLCYAEAFRWVDNARIKNAFSDKVVGSYYSELKACFESISLIDISREIIQRASESFPLNIKTLDAIHLATAILYQKSIKKDLVFITHDCTLAECARAVGFKILGL